MGEQETSLRVLMLPWLAHGHISPFLHLSKKLINRNIFIYFCSTPVNLNTIKKKVDNFSQSIELVELHLPSLPDLPPNQHTTNGLPPHLIPTLHMAYSLSKEKMSNTVKNLKPDVVICDASQPWVEGVVLSLGIPCCFFNTSSAVTVSYFSNLLSGAGVEYPYPEIFVREYEMAAIHAIIAQKDSLSRTRNNDDEGKECLSRESCNVVFVKTFEEIEGKYIKYLGQLSKMKVIPVGPLVEDVVDNDDTDAEILEWLNEKNPCSTVFVSFGSEYFLSNKDMEEIAQGLELSNVNFIWVVRFTAGEKHSLEDVLPKGFKERVRDRGIIVEGWAPQAKILKHSSVGGFVTHCGWNSILESMKLGVAIVATPMQLDQYFNARLVVDLGVGKEVVRDIEGRLQREEVAKVIREVVVENIGENVREKAKELSKCMRDKGDEEIDDVVEELFQVCGKSKQI
uniref:Glycosyltransferase UGT4 n=1 Tax=Bupleurum chinense TaxID=52451 RepID=I3VI30_BUPCH|nr:glycosyltransferase UGT4 [Bupleurum chinense]